MKTLAVVLSLAFAVPSAAAALSDIPGSGCNSDAYDSRCRVAGKYKSSIECTVRDVTTRRPVPEFTVATYDPATDAETGRCADRGICTFGIPEGQWAVIEMGFPCGNGRMLGRLFVRILDGILEVMPYEEESFAALGVLNDGTRLALVQFGMLQAAEAPYPATAAKK